MVNAGLVKSHLSVLLRQSPQVAHRRLASLMTHYVSSGTLNPTHSLLIEDHKGIQKFHISTAAVGLRIDLCDLLVPQILLLVNRVPYKCLHFSQSFKKPGFLAGF